MRWRGVAYPFSKGVNGIPTATQTDAESISDCITQALKTVRGERVFRPEFGSQIPFLVFENKNEILKERIRREIMESLKDEPRARIVTIDVTFEPLNLSSVDTIGQTGVEVYVVFEINGVRNATSIKFNVET